MSNLFKEKLIPVLERTTKEPRELANAIDRSFDGCASLFEADITKLKTVTKNESASELFLIIGALAARQRTEKFKFNKFHSDEEICDFLAGFYTNAAVESVVIIPLDRDGRVLSADTISGGTVNFSSIVPRMIIDKLVMHGSDTFIMAHNHPGGVAEPSDGDVASTAHLTRSLAACGINLKAHYVVARGSCKKIEF